MTFLFFFGGGAYHNHLEMLDGETLTRLRDDISEMAWTNLFIFLVSMNQDILKGRTSYIGFNIEFQKCEHGML